MPRRGILFMHKVYFQPKTNLEKFGAKIINLLVDNSKTTYFVGGTVRDLLLKKKTTDIDIATALIPKQVTAILKKTKIQYLDKYSQFGVIFAQKNKLQAEITTLRKETYISSRFPKVQFVKSVGTDSDRRDFTINSLYLQPKTGKIYDFHHGLMDLKLKQIKFIGNPKTRILEDPLRIIRGLRFSLALGFVFDKKSFQAVKNNFYEVKKLSKNKVASEIMKLKPPVKQKIIWKCLANSKNLDKYF